MIVYGARDISIGLAVFAASYFGNRKTVGAVVLAACAAAWVDGAVVKTYVGAGEWDHWGYASLFTLVGGVMVGMLYVF